MARPKKKPAESLVEEVITRKKKPAMSAEERRNECIALAMSLAEEQLRNKTASSQVITHFLKLATEEAQLERRRLESDIALSEAKIDAYKAASKTDEAYTEAIEAMSRYTRKSDDDSNLR